MNIAGGAYLFELIELSGRKDKIRDAIYKALLTPQKDTWTLTQLFELVLMFAKQGDGTGILIANNVLSDKIKEEIRFDCREGTRKLYEELI